MEQKLTEKDALYEKIEYVASLFEIDGKMNAAHRLVRGHINDSFIASYNTSRSAQRFVIQKINTKVFTQPEKLMANIKRVCDHMVTKAHELPSVPGREEIHDRTLVLVPSRNGDPFVMIDGDYWRTYMYINNTTVVDAACSPKATEELGRAVAEFHKTMQDLPSPPLEESIVAFHDTPARIRALEEAVMINSAGRAESVQKFTDFVLARKNKAAKLKQMTDNGQLKMLCAHNDTKINNLLIDRATGKAVCMVDLDTVMPGLYLHDFGDMVRSAGHCFEEDDSSGQACLDFQLFEGIARGYLSTATAFLSQEELALLSQAAWTITLEAGTRFLTDYLNGDIYFRIRRTNQNLDRAQTHFALVKSMEQNEAQMTELISSIHKEVSCG